MPIVDQRVAVAFTIGQSGTDDGRSSTHDQDGAPDSWSTPPTSTKLSTLRQAEFVCGYGEERVKSGTEPLH
jgi:hypothetical protein